MTQQAQLKIYTQAREMINGIMNDLAINYEFTSRQVSWKTKAVKQQLATFEVHERIKNLIENEIKLHQSNHKETLLNLKSDSLWEITIQDDGAESYYFARMLFLALARLKSGVVNLTSLNCKLIECYATSAAIKAKISALGFDANAEYKNSMYSITLPVNGMILTFANSNVDLLCKGLGLQLRGFLKTNL